MPPIRTDKSRVKHDDNNDKKRPSLGDMYVSVSRVKPFAGSEWNCQVSLKDILYHIQGQKHFELSKLEFYELHVIIENDLGVCMEEGLLSDDGKDWCLVWHMFDSGQLGRVYDDVSFQSAVEDHRRAYKSIVQLYVIESKSEFRISSCVRTFQITSCTDAVKEFDI